MMDTEHFRNWIAAVRSRKTSDLVAEIKEGHLSLGPLRPGQHRLSRAAHGCV